MRPSNPSTQIRVFDGMTSAFIKISFRHSFSWIHSISESIPARFQLKEGLSNFIFVVTIELI